MVTTRKIVAQVGPFQPGRCPGKWSGGLHMVSISFNKPLTRAAVHWQSERLPVSGLELNLLHGGAARGALTVLLHGGSAHGRWWDYVAPHLASRFRLLSLELRGHGESGHALPAAYRLQDYVSDLGAVAAHLGEPFHLIGHSLGAMVAAAYAAEQPQRLRSLVAVDAQLRISAASVHYLRRLAAFPQLVYPDLKTAVARFRVLPTQTNAHREIIEHMAAHAFKQRADGWVLKFDRATLSQLEVVDLVPALQPYDLPVFLVRGSHSTLLSHDRLAALQAQLRRAQSIEIGDAHHHVMLDNPTGLAAALSEFLCSQ